jgi:hypothetical protein
MPYFVDEELENDGTSVGVVDQVVIAPTRVRGDDHFLIIITNPSADDFEGASAASPNGVNQWTTELNDEFAIIPANTTRRMLLPADRLYIRVTGRFSTTPGQLLITTVHLKQATRQG